ncbi:hypothetical protein [Kitasatospora azatica]|uniref:hypothetical protein n=1 Tax=Kitasatospora azatica TaxID=58347 RepID=UPI00056A8FD6|nr:hypothetical protein [Kitasatospora azatica]
MRKILSLAAAALVLTLSGVLLSIDSAADSGAGSTTPITSSATQPPATASPMGTSSAGSCC